MVHSESSRKSEPPPVYMQGFMLRCMSPFSLATLNKCSNQVYHSSDLRCDPSNSDPLMECGTKTEHGRSGRRATRDSECHMIDRSVGVDLTRCGAEVEYSQRCRTSQVSGVSGVRRPRCPSVLPHITFSRYPKVTEAEYQPSRAQLQYIRIRTLPILYRRIENLTLRLYHMPSRLISGSQ